MLVDVVGDLMYVQWCLILVLIFISLVTTDAKHLSMTIDHYILFGKMPATIFCPFYNQILCFSLLNCGTELCLNQAFILSLAPLYLISLILSHEQTSCLLHVRCYFSLYTSS
jgi:hypothetical protein